MGMVETWLGIGQVLLSETEIELAKLSLATWALLILGFFVLERVIRVAIYLIGWIIDVVSPATSGNDFDLAVGEDDNYINVHQSDAKNLLRQSDATELKSKTTVVLTLHTPGSGKNSSVTGAIHLRRGNDNRGRIILPKHKLRKLLKQREFNKLMESETESLGPLELSLKINRNPFEFFKSQWTHPDSAIRMGFKITVWLTLFTTGLGIALEQYYSGPAEALPMRIPTCVPQCSTDDLPDPVANGDAITNGSLIENGGVMEENGSQESRSSAEEERAASVANNDVNRVSNAGETSSLDGPTSQEEISASSQVSTDNESLASQLDNVSANEKFPCDCPTHEAADGRQCGAASAFCRLGGREPEYCPEFDENGNDVRLLCTDQKLFSK